MSSKLETILNLLKFDRTNSEHRESDLIEAIYDFAALTNDTELLTDCQSELTKLKRTQPADVWVALIRGNHVKVAGRRHLKNGVEISDERQGKSVTQVISGKHVKVAMGDFYEN